MRIVRRVRFTRFVVPTAAALVAGTAHAQVGPSTPTDLGGLGVDGYYTYFRLETRGDDRLGMRGVGGRLMWRAGGDSDLPALVQRLAAGLFAEFAPDQDRGFTMLHAGVQGDLSLFRTPLLGRVEPALSLGAGVVQTSVTNSTQAKRSNFALADRKTAAFALSPTFGTRLGLWRQLGIRADVGDFIVFRDKTLHNLRLAGGLSFVF